VAHGKEGREGNGLGRGAAPREKGHWAVQPGCTRQPCVGALKHPWEINGERVVPPRQAVGSLLK